MTIHSFGVELATKYGFIEALLLGYFRYYIDAAELKQDKGKFHNGRYWTYASARGLAKHFPYFSEASTRRAVKRLIDAGLVLKDNFNKMSWDKTAWYSLSDECLEEVRGCVKMTQGVCQNDTGVCQNDTGVCQNDTTIPILSTYYNPPIGGNAREQTQNGEMVNEKHDPRFPGTKYSQEVYSQAVDAYVKFINLPLNANDVDELCCMVDECGLEASIHGLRTAGKNKVRKLSYAAACARNYVEDKDKPKSQRKTAKPKNDIEGTVAEAIRILNSQGGDPFG